MPSKTYTLPILYALMHPHTIRDAGFWTERWWHAGKVSLLFSLKDTASVIYNKNVKFELIWP